MQLTKAQHTALATIEARPGQIEATTRVVQGWGRINGNVEHALVRLGLIEKSEGSRPVTYTTHGERHTFEARWWTLTAQGADALRGAA